MKFSIEDFFSKCDQKFLMENFIFIPKYLEQTTKSCEGIKTYTERVKEDFSMKNRGTIYTVTSD